MELPLILALPAAIIYLLSILGVAVGIGGGLYMATKCLFSKRKFKECFTC